MATTHIEHMIKTTINDDMITICNIMTIMSAMSYGDDIY
jgi:hypothetical protein